MTSVRELIAADLVDALVGTVDNSFNTVFKKVTRDPVVIEELARTSMPLAFVQTSNETREDISMGGTAVTRQGVISYNINLYVEGNSGDKRRNELIQSLEDALDADRTRGGNALWGQITEINNIDILESAPYSSVQIVYEVEYCYTRSSASVSQ